MVPNTVNLSSFIVSSLEIRQYSGVPRHQKEKKFPRIRYRIFDRLAFLAENAILSKKLLYPHCIVCTA